MLGSPLTCKLEAACRIVQQWRSRRWCNRGQLESLIGHLQHAAKVVWPGRTFLHRMVDLLCCFRRRDHPIRLNHQFRLDLELWHTLLSSWNGVSFWLFPGMSPPADVEVVSDASGSLGFGAYLNAAWFSSSWGHSQQSQSFACKAQFPVVPAARVWGAQWPRQHISFRCDEAMVHILNSRTSKVPELMYLLRDLSLSAARFSFSFSAKHVPGVHNEIADALSRFRWKEFWRLAPQANPQPTPLPQRLLDRLTSPLCRNDVSASSFMG